MNQKETLTVQVLKRHIDHGIPKDPYQCPVALAIQELTGSTGVCVDGSGEIEIAGSEGNKQDGMWSNGNDIDEFIDNFDSRITVEPSVFLITRNKWSAETGENAS